MVYECTTYLVYERVVIDKPKKSLVSILNHLPMMVLPTDFAFRIKDLTSGNGPHIYMLY